MQRLGPARAEYVEISGNGPNALDFHIAYYIALTGAYRHGDLGLTYPLMRGTAPLLVALGSWALMGEVIAPLGSAV